MRRLLLAALLPACGASAPAPTPAAQAQAAPPAAEAKAPATPVAAPEQPAKRPPEPPLTQEELDLIATDPATLTPERRRDRAFALRRKIMQNPDSPAARQLEEIRQGVESGAIKPELPKSSGLVLRAPESTPAPAPAAEADKKSP